MNIKLNQEVIVVGIGNNARYNTPIYKGVVSKIGRKWFEVSTGNYVGEREKFSLENGKCDGKGYMSEWQVFESQEQYLEVLKKPTRRIEVEKAIKNLSYKQLTEVLNFIENL